MRGGRRWGFRVGPEGRTGASLAELLVAVTILSIGMAATTGILTLASRGIRHAEVGLRGAMLAAEVLAAGGTGEGAVGMELGTFRWWPDPPRGVEVRYEPPEGGNGVRQWRVSSGAPDAEEPPWWNSWSP